MKTTVLFLTTISIALGILANSVKNNNKTHVISKNAVYLQNNRCIVLVRDRSQREIEGDMLHCAALHNTLTNK